MYFEKTSNRINELVETDSLFKKIFDENFILINNKKFKNWNSLKEKIKEAIDVMYDDEDNTIEWVDEE